MKPETRREAARSELADRCLEARKSVAAFFEWANFNDSRARSGWETWATQRVHDGWTVEAVHARVKDAWLEHRREAGRPARIDMLSRDDFRQVVDAIRGAIGRGDWQPMEPWWERVGQPPPCHDWLAMLNRNRTAVGMLPGPPWE